MNVRTSFFLCLSASLALGACVMPVPAEPEGGQQAAAAPVAGKVTDLAAFERFIATRPKPADFRARYPDVVLILPGEFSTKEFRMDNSRYFAELDEQGRIKGGRFM